MPPPITGPHTPFVPPTPGSIPSGPGGLVRPSDLTGGSGNSLPPGPAGLTGQAPRFLGRSNSMPPRRNALPNLQAAHHQDPGGPPVGDPSSGPPSPGGRVPHLGEAALGAAQDSSNAAIASQNAMMAQMQQTNLMSIYQQMQMSEMESIKAMATALAKTTKSIGKGVSDLAS